MTALKAGTPPGGAAVRALTVASTRHDLAGALAALAPRGSGVRVGVVMTMGALHEGHAALLRRARAESDVVVATVFVNPLQFGAGEDLDRYPRTLAADLELCAREGADLVFTPTSDVMYGGEPVVTVSAGAMGRVLEGAARPGHFDGMLTVVLKLLLLTRADVAFFGRKDAQQLACIRRMVLDLDVGVQVVGVPTVREPDGLALSSRNRYLSPGERTAALALSRALRAGSSGDLAAARAVLAAEPQLHLDYLERVDPGRFTPSPVGGLLVVAARVGSTRLIDNTDIPEGR